MLRNTDIPCLFLGKALKLLFIKFLIPSNQRWKWFELYCTKYIKSPKSICNNHILWYTYRHYSIDMSCSIFTFIASFYTIFLKFHQFKRYAILFFTVYNGVDRFVIHDNRKSIEMRLWDEAMIELSSNLLLLD